MPRLPRAAQALAAGLLCVLGIVAVPVLGNAAATLTATVDDSTTTGTNRFTYSGTWTACGGCNSTAYQNGFRYAYTTGAAATFTFTGTQAKIYGFVEPVGGIASVSVDGGAPVDVDYYSSTQVSKNVFTTAVLASGTHTVKLTVSGRRGSGASATINVDKAEVYTETGTPTPSPTTTTPSPTTTTPSPTTTTPSPTTTTPSPTTTTPSPTTTTTPSGTPVTVDDGVTSGTNRFTYIGSSWTACGGCNATAYQGSFRYAYATGNSATFTFSGTQARLYGFKEPVGGIATVSVDGGAAVDVDYYSPTQTLTPTFTTAVLPNGTHTVTMTVSGRRGSGASATINLDKADVYSGSTPSPTTTTPSPTTTTPSPTTTTPSPTTTTPSPTTTTPSPTTTTTTPSGSAGLVSVTLDDGAVSGYLNARPALKANGLHATFNIVSDALFWQPNYMTPAQAKDLVADGDEIGNHTRDHANLTTLSAAQIDDEFASSQAAITSLIGVTPTTCAYPYGVYNSTVMTEAAKFFTACRTTNGGRNPITGFSKYQLVSYYCQTGTTAADITAAVNAAKASNQWVIFIYHGVGTVQSSDDVTTETFASHMAAIRDSGVPVKTMGEGANG